jgi:hypothetical protein
MRCDPDPLLPLRAQAWHLGSPLNRRRLADRSLAIALAANDPGRCLRQRPRRLSPPRVERPGALLGRGFSAVRHPVRPKSPARLSRPARFAGVVLHRGRQAEAVFRHSVSVERSHGVAWVRPGGVACAARPHSSMQLVLTGVVLHAFSLVVPVSPPVSAAGSLPRAAGADRAR